MSTTTQTPDQTPDQTPGQTPDTVVTRPAAAAPVADLDTAPDGTAPFGSDAANLPEATGEGGVVTTARDGDTGWQLAVINNRPRVIWQRTWHAAEGRWRTWKRFEDSRNAGRATAAAIASAVAASEQEMTALVGRRIAGEAAARSAAITTAVSTAIDDLRAALPAELPAPGLDRDDVAELIEAELQDERAARNDAIAAATSSLAAGRQALIDASITSAITTERVAADRRTDDKLAVVSTRVDGLADDLTAESAVRAAAITAAGSAMETLVTAERDARTAALATQRRAVTAEITEAKQEAASALRTTILAEHGARDQAIATAKSEVARDTATHVAGLFRGLEERIGQTLDTRVAAAGFPRGTRMLFQQSAAPAGWTKDAAVNDKALRVTSGSVGKGGHRGFSQTCVTHRVRGSVSSSISGRTGAHRLSAGEMPSHTHEISGHYRRDEGGAPGGWFPRGSSRGSNVGIGGFLWLRNSHAGGDQPHSHGAGSLRVSSAFTGGALDLRLAYVDVIIAVKD